MRLDTHTLRTWSSSQAVIALSSGEAEYYALVKGASIGLGIQSLAVDCGLVFEVGVRTDSTAAKGIASRPCLSKARHIDTCYLWLQERVMMRDIYLYTVNTTKNLADLLTKRFEALRHEFLMGAVGMRVTSGRHALAPGLAMDAPQ